MSEQTRAYSRGGFSLIEVLVVIAIIAILTAILLPVMNSVQKSAREGGCSTKINQLIKGAKMYRDDFKEYPDVLYGASRDGGPLELTLGVKDYVKDVDAFTCPECPAQFRRSENLVQPLNRMTGAGAVDSRGRALMFPEKDSYDMQYLSAGGTRAWVLNYSRKWTQGLPGMTGYADDPRQLYRRDPPDTTVVTYCMYHAGTDANGVPTPSAMVIVGFLSGRVQKIPGSRMAGWPGPDGRFPWQVTPK